MRSSPATPQTHASSASYVTSDLTSEQIPKPGQVCPVDTYWDSLGCAHPRATCGGWDGASCDAAAPLPLESERAAVEEFAAIDAEANRVCPEDAETGQVYSGHVGEVANAVDAALGRTEQIRQRLARLSEAQQSPRWKVATLARVGSLYDCIWSSLRKAAPGYFTPQQRALLLKLNAIEAQLTAAAGQTPQGPQLQTQFVRAQQLGWLAKLEAKMVRSYVTAALLARRYGLEGFDFTRASERLPIIASILGDEAMSRLLGDMADPTDPEPDPVKRRRLVYAVGAFGIAP